MRNIHRNNFEENNVHPVVEKNVCESASKNSVAEEAKNVTTLEPASLDNHFRGEEGSRDTGSLSKNIDKIDTSWIENSAKSLNDATNCNTSHKVFRTENTAHNDLNEVELLHREPHIHEFERNYPILAGKIKTKIEVDPIEWFCHMVCSDLAFEMKCQQAKYGIFVSDQLLDCAFALVFEQHSEFEIETGTVTRANGLGFRGKHINEDLLRMGKQRRNLGHLTEKDLAHLRAYVSSGRWRRFEPYIQQVIAIAAAELCPGCIPGKFKEWLKPYIRELEKRKTNQNEERLEDQYE